MTTAEVSEKFSITMSPALHGSDGPVQVSYPPFTYPVNDLFVSALAEEGIKFNKDTVCSVLHAFSHELTRAK